MLLNCLKALLVLLALTVSASAQSIDTSTGGTPTAAPEQVIVGVFINDIHQLNLSDQSYLVDFYIWFRWKSATLEPHKTMEYMNPFEKWDHVATPLYDEPLTMPDGSKYMAIRHQGRFASRLSLERYPFDRQELMIEFEDNTSTANLMRYVQDDEVVSINSKVDLTGYLIGKPRLDIADNQYSTRFGDISTHASPYSRGIVVIPIKRPTTTYAIKSLTPLVLIVLCAALMFFIHPAYFEGRIGLGITALLTMVALQLTTNATLPSVDYLMLIDVLYFLAYMFIVVSIGAIVWIGWTTEKSGAEAGIALDRRAAAFLLVFYAALSVASIVLMTRS